MIDKMAALGLMGVPFPEEYGGAGGDTLSYAIAVEEISRGDGSLGLTLAAHTSLGASPFYLFGTPEQKRRIPGAPRPGQDDRRVRPHRSPTQARTRAAPKRSPCKRTASGSSTAPSST